MRITDSKNINLEEYYEIEYWCEKFHVTPEILKRAVKESGTVAAEEVEKYIRSKYPLK